MTHSCCVPECRKKGYRTVIVDGKEVKVSFHKLPNTKKSKAKSELRKRWIVAIRRDVG